ncbi:MAG: hypothetical protein HC905_32340 [Bacteroidales bacterium]|nr:hypothetical protein [Bacteroidales bacterium]
MIRTVVKADKNIITLNLPNSYVGKQVEVIAFTVDEPKQKQELKKAKSFTTVNINAKGYKFNRDELYER